MATDDSTGTGGTADEPTVEGSWSPRRGKASAKKAAAAADGKASGRSRSSDPEVLAEEIEKTREELAETLDAIAEKVSPKRVTARATKKVGAAAAGAVDSVKQSVGHGADEAETPVEPVVTEAPPWTTTLQPESPSRLPVLAGAGAALVVLLLVLRRRRR